MGKALRTALPRTSPVCISFFLLALSYGVLMGTRGFSFLWPMCMSAFIFTGSMEFVTVNLLVSAFNPFVTFMLAVMLGTRHLFYGISMLGRFKNMGAKKPYLIFSLCDETFAIDNGTIIAADVDRGWFYFFVGLLNQSSWVAGATLGGLLGERITFNTSGLDFIMTAMFAVIFVDQWLTTKRKSHMAALTGHSGARDLSGGVRRRQFHDPIPGRHARHVHSAAAIPGRPEDRQDGRGERNEQRGQGDERMMIMTTWQGVITIIMAMLGTMLTRFLPFLLFPESKEPPRFITYLGTVSAVCHDRPACRVLAQRSAPDVRQPRHSRIVGDYRNRPAAHMEKEHAAVDRRRHRRLYAAGTAGFLVRRLPPVLGIAITWRAPSRI